NGYIALYMLLFYVLPRMPTVLPVKFRQSRPGHAKWNICFTTFARWPRSRRSSMIRRCSTSRSPTRVICCVDGVRLPKLSSTLSRCVSVHRLPMQKHVVTMHYCWDEHTQAMQTTMVVNATWHGTSR